MNCIYYYVSDQYTSTIRIVEYYRYCLLKLNKENYGWQCFWKTITHYNRMSVPTNLQVSFDTYILN